MPLNLKTNAPFRFDDYRVVDEGIELVFTCLDPGPGQMSQYTVQLTDAELAGVSTQVALRNLVQGKLDRKIRAVAIATKLDAFLGQSLTV